MGPRRDMKDIYRGTKNFIKGYSRWQVRVRQATNTDPWGPTTAQMAEIARSSFSPTIFTDIIYVLDRRLNDHGKYWRHVYKSLVLLEYCVVMGPEAMVRYATDNYQIIRTLKDFQYVDHQGKDMGAFVRQKSRELAALLGDDVVLREARRTKQIPSFEHLRSASNSPLQRNPKPPTIATRNQNEYDEQIQRALEESRRTAAEEATRRQSMDDAFFRNMQESKPREAVHAGSPHSSGNIKVTHTQPRIIMTQVPHVTTINIDEPGDRAFDFLKEDPFENHDLAHSKKQEEYDPFANATEVEIDSDPFKDAEEVEAIPPATQPNTGAVDQVAIPMPRQLHERVSLGDESIGAKPVKPMNLTPGFSTRKPSNVHHFNQ